MTSGFHHFHHGAEELLVVLRGRPTLRVPDGERVLDEGDVVHFPVGPAGAHQLINRTQEPVRFRVASLLEELGVLRPEGVSPTTYSQRSS